MRIQHNVTALNSYRNYTNNTTKLGKNLEKLSSGYAINRAGDDAAGLAVSQKMRLNITATEQAIKNAKSGISYVQTAEGAMQEVHEMLERMYTLAEQKENGIYTNADKANIAEEMTALSEEMKRIGSTAKFNGQSIFQSTAVQFAIDPESSKISVTLDTMSGIVGSLGVGQSYDSSNLPSKSDISTASANVSTKRAKLGAIQNRLEHTINNLGVMKENMTEAESVVRDTDMAEEMMKYTKNSILVQSAQAMLAQANQLPQGVLQLLQ